MIIVRDPWTLRLMKRGLFFFDVIFKQAWRQAQLFNAHWKQLRNFLHKQATT